MAAAAVAALAALAFLLRAYHLASQSLWYDEGFSVYLAGMSLADITSRTATDIHPPLYYYLLHGWMLAAGRTEFALRFLSAFFSALTVPVMFQLGRRLAAPARADLTGLLAALLATVSPFYVWYAQEARMYSMLTLLGALTSVLLLRMLGRAEAPSRRVLVAWTALSIAAVYTHFYAFFILAFQAIVALRPRRTSGRVEWPNRSLAGAFVAVFAAYLPWLGITFKRLGSDVSYWEGQLDAAEVITKTFLAFAAGHTSDASEEPAIGALYLLMLVLGCVAAVLEWRKSARTGTGPSAALFLLTYLLVPPILLYAVSACRPKFHPRYLMLSSPPFYLLVAWAVASMASIRSSAGKWLRNSARGAAILAAVLLIIAAVVPLGHYYRNEVLARDDFRSAARWIGERIAPDETVLLVSGHMFPVFDYYLPRQGTIRLPDQPTLSTRDTIGYGVAGALNQGLAGRAGVWLVLWQDNVVDPNGIVVSMLEQQGRALPVEQSFWGLRLLHYALPPTARFSPEPDMKAALNVTFGDELLLKGYRVAQAYPGEPFMVTVYWQALKATAADYQIVLRLVDDAGVVWGTFEGRPAAYQHPTFRWAPGDTIPGSVPLAVLPGTPPGEYVLDIGVYPVSTGNRLEARGAGGAPLGQSPRIGSIAVAPARRPPDPADLARLIPTRIDRPAAPGLSLVGHSLRSTQARPGDLIPVTLVWQATATPAADYALRLRLAGAAGQPTGARTFALSPAAYPTSKWRAGEFITSKLSYVVPAGAAAGSWVLQAQVTLAGAPAGEAIDLAPVAVAARPTPPPAGSVQHATNAAFAGGARLQGYSIARGAAGLDVTLVWSADTEIQSQYTIFVHVLDAAGAIIGQHDGAPAGGSWPTTAWLPGAAFEDKHSITMPALPAGSQVTLAIGLYDAATQQRLPLAGSTDDRLLLGPVAVP